MKISKLALNTALLASLASLTAFADLKPIAENSKTMEFAQQASDTFMVKQIRSGNYSYKLVTLNTSLNGDSGTTSILLTGNEVGSEAGFESSFLLTPRESINSASDIIQTTNGVELTYLDAEGKTIKQAVKYDSKSKTLKEAPAVKSENCENQDSPNAAYQCVMSEITKADAALNAAYAKVKKGARDEIAKKKLLTAEKAWLAFRATQCDFEADEMRGGNGEKELSAGCYLQMTKDRTAALLIGQ